MTAPQPHAAFDSGYLEAGGGGVWECAFLPSSQVILLVPEPHFENPYT